MQNNTSVNVIFIISLSKKRFFIKNLNKLKRIIKKKLIYKNINKRKIYVYFLKHVLLNLVYQKFSRHFKKY